MTKTPEWVTEEKKTKRDKEIIAITHHSSLPKLMRSIMAKIYKLKNVSHFTLDVPGLRFFDAYKKEGKPDEHK